MALDDAWNTFGQDDSSGWTLPVDTLSTDLPTGAILAPVPQNVVSVDRDSGISVTGILNGVTSTAESLTNVFGKVYNLVNNAKQMEFQQEVAKSTLELNKAKTLGGLELGKATLDAERQIGVLKAQQGVANTVAQMNSPGALRAAANALPGWLPLLGIAFLGYKAYKGHRA